MNIPDEELGVYSPLKVSCEDRKVDIGDFFKCKDELKSILLVLNRVFKCETKSDFEAFTPDEIKVISDLDRRFDIPRTKLVYMLKKGKLYSHYNYLEEGAIDPYYIRYDVMNYDLLVDLLRSEYNRIPDWFYKGTHMYLVASEKGNLHVLKWLYRMDKGVHLNELKIWNLVFTPDLAETIDRSSFHMLGKICSSAAMYGHLHILEWMIENHPDVWTIEPLMFAARYGHLNILKWAVDKKIYYKSRVLHPDLYVDAIIGGYLDILKWLRYDNALEWPTYYYRNYKPLKNLNSEVVDWLKDNNYPYKVEKMKK